MVVIVGIELIKMPLVDGMIESLQVKLSNSSIYRIRVLYIDRVVSALL